MPKQAKKKAPPKNKKAAAKSTIAIAAKPATKKKVAPAAKKRATAPAKKTVIRLPLPPLPMGGGSSEVLDRLWQVVMDRRDADPAISHSARLLSRGTAKVAQKFGEEAVECVIEAMEGNQDALIGESADVLYHLIVLWVNAGLRPSQVWEELQRREGVSGITEKASRAKLLPAAFGLKTTKIP
jgi:phosphoribosyl-ATP pyrophosphohydrolase